MSVNITDRMARRMERGDAERMVLRGEAMTRDDALESLGRLDGLRPDVRCEEPDPVLEAEGRWVDGEWVWA